MDIGPEFALAAATALVSIGVSWGVMKTKEKRNSNGHGLSKEDKEKIAELDLEIRSLKVLLLGVEGQGGIVNEIRSVRTSRHDLVNKVQALYGAVRSLTDSDPFEGLPRRED